MFGGSGKDKQRQQQNIEVAQMNRRARLEPGPKTGTESGTAIESEQQTELEQQMEPGQQTELEQQTGLEQQTVLERV